MASFELLTVTIHYYIDNEYIKSCESFNIIDSIDAYLSSEDLPSNMEGKLIIWYLDSTYNTLATTDINISSYLDGEELNLYGKQQKFLDQKGVEYLWSKISMQDYPNNETLISVIEAIDETKADKTEIPFIDDTLVLEDAAANAKAVGDKIQEILSQLVQVQIITWEADD